MKGLYGRKGFDLQLRELTARPLGPWEVQLQVLAYGVCGTDLHLMRQAEEHSPLGHEVCARVVACGSEAKRFRVGQQVVMEDVAPLRRLRPMQVRPQRPVPLRPQHGRGTRHSGAADCP